MRETGEPGRRLRVAMVAPPSVRIPPRRYGGTELVVAELIDGLVEQGAQVTLFASGDSRGGYRHRCEVRSLFEDPSWPPAHWVDADHSAFAFHELAQAGNAFDVIHAHLPELLPLAPLLPQPVVYTLHHEVVDQLSRLYSRHPEVTYACISARQLELCGPFNHGAVVHHGIDAGRYRLGAVDPEHLAFLGRLSEVKGPDRAIDVARLARLRIRVAGRPHEQDHEFFLDKVQARLRQPHVSYLGEIGHHAKVELLSRARALLFPIGWEEPFGLAAIEAMLCGCPVLAFPRGAVPEIVDEGLTGFLAHDEHEMARLIRGPAAPERFDRAACRQRAIERFGMTRMVGQYLHLYWEAIERAALKALAPLSPRLPI